MTKQCSKCKKVYPDTPENFFPGRGQCPLCRCVYQKRYFQKHSQRLTTYKKKYDERHREQTAARERSYMRRLRLEVLNHYSPNGPRCACCGEDHVEFPVIDHINGGGGQHRKRVGSGSHFYRWLKGHGFPKGFRVLCNNCNASLGLYGHCPHETDKHKAHRPLELSELASL